MATDYVLAAVAWLLARGIVRANGSRAARLWAVAFVVTGAAALAGGSVHGFGFLLPRRLEQVLWAGAVMSVGVATAGLLAGAVVATVGPGPLRRLLLGLCAAKAAFYLAWTARHPHFRYAAWDSLPAALLVLAFLVRWRVRGGPREAAMGAAGLGLSVAGAVLQQAGVGIHPTWFNHNDLYHVVQTASLWLLARAGRVLRDAT
jgi:uncharacterized protein DUF6962